MVRFSLLLAVFACFAAAASAQAIDYDRLDRRLTQLAQEDDIVGLAVGVIEGGEITFARGYGVTAEGEGPVTRHTVFRWASLSKGVATSLVTKLAMEGQFALTDTLASFQTSLRLPG
ncbi:MAG: serine hydrolase, partial [Hyphomonas sp.]